MYFLKPLNKIEAAGVGLHFRLSGLAGAAVGTVELDLMAGDEDGAGVASAGVYSDAAGCHAGIVATGVRPALAMRFCDSILGSGKDHMRGLDLVLQKVSEQ